jgi:hypothetical protein
VAAALAACGWAQLNRLEKARHPFFENLRDFRFRLCSAASGSSAASNELVLGRFFEVPGIKAET